MARGDELGLVLRGVLHRARRELAAGVRGALSEVRAPVEARVRRWVADRYPRLRRYEGAQGGRRGAGWSAQSTSANTEIIRDLVKLRDRARDLGRNDPVASRILEALTIHAVGTGIIPKSATGDTRVDAAVDALWSEWALRSQVYARQALAVRAMFEAGEALVQRVPLMVEDGYPVPLDIEVLEGDYLDHTLDGAWSAGDVPDGHYLVQGVEFDARNRRVAYHLWRHHPGDTGIARLGRGERVRVEARDLSHLYRQIRPGQVRGVTVLAPVMWTLRQIGTYLDAELERKGTEALVVGVVTNSEPGRFAAAHATHVDTDADGNSRVIGSLEPGALLNVDGATGVTFNHPTPTDTAEAVKGFLRRIAAGVGIPYELLSADLSGVNYSSIRYGTLPFRLGVWMLQDHVVVPLACAPTWRWFIDAAIASGRLPPRAGGYPCKWAPPRWEEVDRLKEAMADVAEIRSGLRSYQDVLASRGENWHEVMQEAEDYLEAMQEHGLSFDSDPRRPQSAPAATVDPAADPAPEAPQSPADAEPTQAPPRSRSKRSPIPR